MTGFIGSTEVHAASGRVRIDQIRVGDLVLATKSGSTPRPTLVRVQRVLGPSRAVIMYSGYMDRPSLASGTKSFRLFTTSEQEFWTHEDGWVHASRLLGDWMGPSKLVAIEGVAFYSYPRYVYKTTTSNVGWVGSATLEGFGYTWDFATECFRRSEDFDINMWPQDTTQRFSGVPFEAIVYALTLEGADVMFVGEHGIAVRSA